MISSPCKNCANVDLPKEYCSTNCLMIQELQTRALTQVSWVAMALEYSDIAENSYSKAPSEISMGWVPQ